MEDWMNDYISKSQNLNDEEMQLLLESNGYKCVRKLEDGTWVALARCFTRWRS